MNGTVLITGGSGYLGMHLAARFAERGAAVKLLDVVDPEPRTPGEFVRGDVRDPEAVANATDGADTVIHTAFASPRQGMDLLHSVNVGGTQAVCEAALERGARVVLISSTIVEKPPCPHPLMRGSALSRLDSYRAARVEAERIAAQYLERGLSVAIVRPKTFLGPGRVSAFAIMLEAARKGRTVPILGNGRNQYQLLEIGDLAEGVRLLAASGSTGVFHFGARLYATVAEEIRAMLRHAGTGSRLKRIPAPIARAAIQAAEMAGLAPFSEYHQMCARGLDSVVDIGRAGRELGWKPLCSSAEALISAYDWYTREASQGKPRATHTVPASHRLIAGLARFLPG